MGADSSGPKQEQYLQTYFKNEVNAVLREHSKPPYRKLPPDWSSIAKRLEGVSINTMSTLRHDFHHGWQNWAGSEFSKLHESLQNNSSGGGGGGGSSSSKEDGKQSAPATLTPKLPKLKFKTIVKVKTKAKASSRTPKEDYHPEDGEYTAAKSVSKISSQF
jgi:hypothetical protein